MMDIQTEQHIDALVEAFYNKIRNNPDLGSFFTETNWEHHLPRMKSFWCFILLDKMGFKGNIYESHVNRQIKSAHFDIWVSLFCETVDELYKGEIAEKAKSKAKELAILFNWKLQEKEGL